MKKKFFVVMVLIMMLMATVGMAESVTTLIPEIEFKDLDTDLGGYDMKIYMYMSMPEYEHAKMVLSVEFNGDDKNNYNSSMATLYDGSTGEFIDATMENITSDIDCSSMDTEIIISEMKEYFSTYDFEAEAERGVTYEKVIICY